MAGLTGTQIKNTYGDVLQLGNSGSGVTSSLQRVADGLGTSCSLLIATNLGGFGISTSSPALTVDQSAASAVTGLVITSAALGSGVTCAANVVAGTNVAGETFTLSAGVSTGTGLGGSIVFKVANKGSTGTTANTLGTILTLAPPNSGTTAVVNGVTITGAITTAAVAVAATGSDTNIPLTINAKGSGTISIGNVSTGAIVMGLASSGTTTKDGGNAWALAGIANTLRVYAGGGFGWSATSDATGAIDTSLQRGAAGVIVATNWLQNAGGLSRVKTSDVTTVSVTPANITGLSFTSIAGRGYSGELVLYLDDATAADGIRIDFDGGAGTWTSFIAQGTVTDTVGVRNLARTTAIATDLVDATTTGSAIVIIKFSGVANAAGTFIPRIAKSTDAAGATLTLRVGSYMKVDDMP